MNCAFTSCGHAQFCYECGLMLKKTQARIEESNLSHERLGEIKLTLKLIKLQFLCCLGSTEEVPGMQSEDPEGAEAVYISG
tara:strand:- start:72 stop:314 length:243 start_codon:yes stop_codon:yes gene_type:complete